MNKKISVTVLIISLVIAESLVFFGGRTDAAFTVYRSDSLGISFAYPKTYFVVERELGNGERYHHQVALYQDSKENRDVLAGKSPGREGPVSITLDLYQNDLDKLPLETWIKTMGDSNFKLGNGVLVPDTVSGNPALSYVYSGLYENKVTAFTKDGSIALLAVSYINPGDQILKDFAFVRGNIHVAER